MGARKDFPIKITYFLKYFFSVGLLYFSYICFASNHALRGFAAAIVLAFIPFIFAKTTTNHYRTAIALSLLIQAVIVLFGNDDYRKLTGYGMMLLMFVAFQLGERKSKLKDDNN